MSTQWTVAEILRDTIAHGFVFLTETVKYHANEWRAQIVKVEDQVKFDATFTGLILKSLNGTSIRVGSQAVARRTQISAGGKATDEQLKRDQINWLLGIEISQSKTLDDLAKEMGFDSAAEMKEALAQLA